MNKTIWSLAIVLIFTCSVSMAQVIINEDGIYYNEKKELYTGTYIEFHTNGNKRIEISLINGILDGKVNLYFESGVKNEVRSYAKGKMDGVWITWNETGLKIAEANYKNNLKNGDWFIWDDEGTLRFEMHYKEGEKTGIWKMYNEMGEIVSEEEKD